MSWDFWLALAVVVVGAGVFLWIWIDLFGGRDRDR